MRARWAAGLPSRSGRTAKIQGDLVLTDRRLIFDPVQMFEALSPLTAPYVRDAIKRAMRPLPLADVGRVAGDTRRRGLVHVDSRHGRHSYLVASTRDTPPWRRWDEGAVDALLDALGRI